MEKVDVKCNYLTYGFGFIELLDYRSQPITNMTQEQEAAGLFCHAESQALS